VCSNIREAFSWAETSQTIVRLPSAAARIPRATETVVLPTPPLPVTITNRLSRSSGIGQFLAISYYGRKKAVPSEYPRNGISKPQEEESGAGPHRGEPSARRRATGDGSSGTR